MDLQILAAAPVDRRAAAVANMEGTECCVGSPRGGFPEREAKGLIWPPRPTVGIVIMWNSILDDGIGGGALAPPWTSRSALNLRRTS